jgi:hypothetical protein
MGEKMGQPVRLGYRVVIQEGHHGARGACNARVPGPREALRALIGDDVERRQGLPELAQQLVVVIDHQDELVRRRLLRLRGRTADSSWSHR